MISIKNRRASFDYEFIDTYNAGIVLYGSEVKSIRKGNVSLSGTFCYIDNGEVWIKNSYIKNPEHIKGSNMLTFDEQRSRKLLLNKKEIRKLNDSVKQKGLTIIPYMLYSDKNNRIKCEIKLCRGKHTYDKKETLKERDLKRENGV